MASSYTAFDSTKPAGTQTGPAFATSASANDVALWYACVQGGSMPGWTFTKSGGTTEEPLYYIWSNGTQIVRSTNTWTSGYLTQQVWQVSQDSGAAYASVCTQTMTYDGTTGALTATTGAGGMMSVVGYVIGKLKALKTAYDAHAAAPGSSAHGLGTMSIQNANAVAITSGTASLTYEREAKGTKGTVSSSTALDWGAAGLYTATCATGAAFTHSNLPSGVVGFLTLDLTMSNTIAAGTLLSGVKWPGGTAPTFATGERSLVTLMCHDGATINGVQLRAMA